MALDPGPRVDSARLEALRLTGLLDGDAPPAFDRLTRLAARLLGVPMSAVSLVDDHRQFYLSAFGLAEPLATSREVPLSQSFARHVVSGARPVVISDTTNHPITVANPDLASLGVIAYAGMPITLLNGQTVGAFCAGDTKPRGWTDDELATVDDLCQAVTAEVELLYQLHAREQAESDAESWIATSAELLGVLDAQGRIMRVSPSWQTVLGWRPEEILGMFVWPLLHPGDLVPVQQGLGQLAQGDDPRNIPRVRARFRAKDESYIPFEWTGSRTSSGAFFICGRIIVVQLQMEDELRASELRQRSLLAAMPDMIFRLSRDGVYLDFKAEVGETYVDPSLILGARVTDLLPAELASRVMASVGEALSTGTRQSLSYSLAMPDAEHFYEARIVRSGPDEVVCVVRDITAAHNNLQEIEASKLQLAGLLGALPDAIIRVRGDGTYLEFKEGETPLPGGFDESLPGRNVADLFPPIQAAMTLSMIENVLRTGEIATSTLRVPMADSIRFYERRMVKAGSDEILTLVRETTGEHQRAAALEASEERFRSVFETLHDVYYRTDVVGTFTMVSPSSAGRMGYAPDELVGALASTIFVNRDDYLRLKGALFREGSVSDFEVMMRHRDGADVPVSINATLLRDTAGNVVGTQGTLRDITRRREIEDQVHASEARYRRLMDTAAEGIWMVDAAGKTVFANAALGGMLATTADDIMARPPGDFMDPEWAAKLDGTRAARRAGEVQQSEFKYRKADGTDLWTWISLSPMFTPNGTYEGVLIMVTDITERRQAEEERDRIFTASIDMLAVMTDSGRFIRTNPAWEGALGYESAELVGQSLWHFVHADDREEGIDRTRVVAVGADVHDVRLRMQHQSGDFRWLSWNVGAATADGRCYAVVRDITDQVDAEVQQEELMAALEMHAVSLAEQAHEMDKLRVEAEFIANHDALTGCMNRRSWFEWGTSGRPTAVAIYDIDHFKTINDTYGHPVGDHVLKEVAWRLQAIFDGEAMLGRIGGEEFAVLFEAMEEDSIAVARDAVDAIADQPIVLPDGTELTVTISAGLAAWMPSKHSREESLAFTYEAADKALYQAKEGGRRRLCVYDPAAATKAA